MFSLGEKKAVLPRPVPAGRREKTTSGKGETEKGC